MKSDFKHMTKKILGAAGVTALALLPLLAAAQVPSPVQVQGNPIDQLFGIIRTIANYFLTAVIVIAALMVIYAGWTYMTAGGDEGKVSSAKNIIIYAVVGVGVALLAQLIVAVAGAIVGAR